MATSSSGGRRVLGYLESARNLVGCTAGAGGLVLHFLGMGGRWWPAVVVALYGAGALLTPSRRPSPGTALPARPVVPEHPVVPEPEVPPALPVEPVDPFTVEVDALARSLADLPLPASARLDELLDRLRIAGPDGEAERILRDRLPLAVDGYLRARTWQRWAPGSPDPAVELDREVGRMAAALAD
ncbi:hypothetical protein ACIGZJ_02550 [Kitasatospora sp. NPDC052868]|uniref:hypothetical protein n=1 Tax=Kitasatospora sp. NPDC052868 TaxID=3364060 RepID=UPI0037CC2AEC